MRARCPRAVLVPAISALFACSAKEKPASSADTSATIVRDATTFDLRSYTLDMDKMRRYASAAKLLDQESRSNPSLAIDVNIGNEPISESIATIERNDFVTDVLKRAGTTPREFVMTMVAYLQAATTSAALDADPKARIPAGQNTDNVEFVRAHRTEIEPILRDAGLSP
jgi:hypothetical protein